MRWNVRFVNDHTNKSAGKELIRILKKYRKLERDLDIVHRLQLPQSCIAAGYVRNAIWDDMHQYRHPTPLNDIDVLYFDPSDVREVVEKEYESRLNNWCSEYDWSVKNQARMHLRNGHAPYHSVEDAMLRWPETATAVGIRLNENGQLQVIGPFGLEDNFQLIVRQSPHFQNRDQFKKRIDAKMWKTIWPKLQFIE